MEFFWARSGHCFRVSWLGLVAALTWVVTPGLSRADYAETVLADGAAPYFRLAETEGDVALDGGATQSDALYEGIALRFAVPGLLNLDPDRALNVVRGGIRRAASAGPRAYTIEGWFKPGQLGAQTLIARVDERNFWTELVGIGPAATFQHYLFDGAQRSVTSTTSARIGSTYHVVATATNQGMMRLFINGVEEGSAVAIGSMAAGHHWQAGLPCDAGWGGFVGTMDEIAYYDRALTAAQVRAHYQAGLVPPSPLPGGATATVRRTRTRTLTPPPTRTPIAAGTPAGAPSCQCFPATGQSVSHQGRDDGDLQHGCESRFTDNRDGTISDHNSGLMWEKKVALDLLPNVQDLHDADNCYPWSGQCSVNLSACGSDADCPAGEACQAADCQRPLPLGYTVFQWVQALNAQRFAGHADWRVPNVRELASLVDFAQSAPSVAAELNQCEATCFEIANPLCSCTDSSRQQWTSTGHATNGALAWWVFFTYGEVGAAPKAERLSVRAVRGGS